MGIHKLVLSSITLMFKHASLCGPARRGASVQHIVPAVPLLLFCPYSCRLYFSSFVFLVTTLLFSPKKSWLQWSQSCLSLSNFRTLSSLGDLLVYIVLYSYLSSILTPVVFILLSPFFSSLLFSSLLFSSLLFSSLHAENILITVITVFLSVGATSAHSTPFTG